MNDFYDRLAPFYHIIYKDWDTAVETQATQLSTIMHDHWGEKAQHILDVSCGIGTQTLGLAAKGYSVTASDLSPKEIQRAIEEARLRHLNISFSVCDMREAYNHHQIRFDVVISCDNSIPHLLSDGEILKALKQMYACTCTGGGCLLTVRDYDKEERGQGLVKPYGVREDAGKRYFVFQVWDFEGDIYDVSMYFIEENRQSDIANTHVMRSRYYAITPTRLMQLMEAAGYTSVTRLDEPFFQPVLVGTRSA
ncbi:class I SAM-dependent methyltransferase [Leptothoe sp. ISB3NOV94-8A]